MQQENAEDLNRFQIIRQDARSCFVEAKSDSFSIGKVHLEFASYDANKPAGQRQTNHIHIYLAIPDFLSLTAEATSGLLLAHARALKASNKNTPLYESLGGTSADRLKQYGRSRPDGKSLSRTVRLSWAKKDDHYMFTAASGPGDTDAKGLIVPRFGDKPENIVGVVMSARALNAFLITVATHYQAWLSAKYLKENGENTQNPQKTQNVKQDAPRQAQPKERPAQQSATAGNTSPSTHSGAASVPQSGVGDNMQMF